MQENQVGDPLQVRDENCLVQEEKKGRWQTGTLSGRRMGLEWSGHGEEEGCAPHLHPAPMLA